MMLSIDWCNGSLIIDYFINDMDRVYWFFFLVLIRI